MRFIANGICLAATASLICLTTIPVVAQQQNNQRKSLPPPSQRAAPVRPVPARPAPVQQMRRPQQTAPGARAVQPGSVRIRQGAVIPHGEAVARPGAIRGPAGALKRSLPPGKVHNAYHRAGNAASRYNRQAFIFKRGNRFYRRFYYLAAGAAVGAAAGTFFYDEAVPATDPALSMVDPEALQECPAESDNCQGFDDGATNEDEGQPAMPAVDRGAAIQTIMAARPQCGWRDDGVIHFEHEETVVPYEELEARKEGTGSFFSPERLYVRGSFDPPYNEVCIVISGAYAENKALYDRTIEAMRALGIRINFPVPGVNQSSRLANPTALRELAPPVYKVKFDTSKGAFAVEVHRDWAPNGADRFYNLVKSGFYDNVRFFRVIPGFMVQFGINGDPNLSSHWREAYLPDDPVEQSNRRGYVTYAMAGPNTRTSQVFINFADNTNLDGNGFAPFGRVISGMNVVDALNAEYGEGAPNGNGPDQGRLQNEGNTYLMQNFGRLDYVKKAMIQK